ncbi:MAG: hypothetical protein AB7U95_00305 [Reyranella sp.]
MTATYRDRAQDIEARKAVWRDSESGGHHDRTGSYRIGDTLGGMWLSDEAIAAEIDQLESSGRPASIARLRQALRDHHGHASGTDRLRRLLAGRSPRLPGRAATAAPVDDSVVSGPVDELVGQVRTLLQQNAAEPLVALVVQLAERAERAEERERAHQDRWAIEIDTLRQQLKIAARNPPVTAGRSAAEWAALENALVTARETISALREQLSTVEDTKRPPSSA